MNLLRNPFVQPSADSPLKLRVLLVDDQPICRELVRRYLMVSGLGEFRFVEAADGEAALKHFDSRKFDLVFMDHHMPGIEGIEAATRMRASRGEHKVPMIIMSGDGRVGVLEDALDVAQADCFLRKPFSLEELKRCVAPIVSELRKGRG